MKTKNTRILKYKDYEILKNIDYFGNCIYILFKNGVLIDKNINVNKLKNKIC